MTSHRASLARSAFGDACWGLEIGQPESEVPRVGQGPFIFILWRSKIQQVLVYSQSCATIATASGSRAFTAVACGS